MPTVSTAPKSNPIRQSEPDLRGELATLASEILDYAQKARVERFRYCRRPDRPRSPHSTLKQAVQALDRELRDARAKPLCQTRAVDLLRELASLGHQPPCQAKAEQALIAQLVNSALLDLR